MFCPKCGSILLPKKEGSKKVLVCSCGYKESKAESATLKDKPKTQKDVEVVDKEVETHPITKAECPKCGHNEAYYWEVQTRASDEPATKFLKCVKCKHVWRDYS